MLLSQVAKKRQMLRVDCGDCGAQTILDPMFFISRRGDVSLEALRPNLVCGGGGASNIKLQPTKADAVGHSGRPPTDT
jgi:hypothetical protein